MKTAYVITSGSYSDYGISGVFSTKEKAEEFVSNNQCDDYDIEEWSINELEGQTHKTVWTCHLNKETGDVEFANEFKILCDKRYTASEVYKEFIKGESSVSAEHARKLAVEKRQEWLRGLHI
jgi:hypothetical protein